MKPLSLLLAGALALALAASALAQNAFPPVGTMFSVTFGSTTTAITKLISGIAGKSIYLTQMSVHPVSTAVLTLTYGTGTNCGTGPTVFYGPATFGAQENVYIGSGAGTIFIVPQAKDVCVTVATAIAPGWLSYAQF